LFERFVSCGKFHVVHLEKTVLERRCVGGGAAGLCVLGQNDLQNHEADRKYHSRNKIFEFDSYVKHRDWQP
jgi:hypothetical protein